MSKVNQVASPENMLQFGIAMIAHFSGDEISGAAFDNKQRMVNFLQTIY